MKIAVVQFNPTVGALEQNTQCIIEWVGRAERAGADLVLLPELAVLGYPPQDLLERPGFLSAVWRCNEEIVRAVPGRLAVVFGTVGRGEDGSLGNEAWVVHEGRTVLRARKQLLPTYDVFDEARHFAAGTALGTFRLGGKTVAVTICEDAWGQEEDLAHRYATRMDSQIRSCSPSVVLNLSASPFAQFKAAQRLAIFQRLARVHDAVVVVANQVGGNDELVFDGASLVWSKGGEELLGQAPAFEEALLVVDLDSSADDGVPGRQALCAEQPDRLEAVYRALTLGLRDYVRKCGFEQVVLGLSGGIDSALTAVLAVDALGSQNVLGVAMPSRYSSEGSVRDAEQLARNLEIEYRLVDIDPIYQAYLETVGPLLDSFNAPRADDASLENLQARTRGATLMALSNRTGSLVLTTGNKSEVAVGYCTLYGDMVGGLAVLSDVPKTLVYELSGWINRTKERIPRSSIDKPPSAELRPDQLDEDSLPPYEVLDEVVRLYVEEHISPAEIIDRGLPEAAVMQVIGLIKRSEYKRRQAPPGLIVSRKAFGSGRRIPVANRFWERASR